MNHLAYSFWILLLAGGSLSAQTKLPNFKELEVPVFEPEGDTRLMTQLKMGYAKSEFQDAHLWFQDGRRKRINKIQLVFTKYPVNKTTWITPYDSLLQRRLRSIYALSPQIKGNPKIEWEFILQTDCRTEEDAIKLFHGVVLHYQVYLTPNMKKKLKDLAKVIQGYDAPNDSTVFNVFERNNGWHKSVIVNDWTGSMYPYGAQLMLWHKLNLDKSKVSHLVFFNDGNNKRDDEKIIGNVGGIYIAEAKNMKEIYSTMATVMKHGNGGDDQENDIEALLYALEEVPDLENLVLIADNDSPIRDMILLDSLSKPVKIIVCGADKGDKIHSDYLRLAQKTNGSIHTISEDITEMAALKEGEEFSILGIRYRVVNGEILPIKLESEPTEEEKE